MRSWSSIISFLNDELKRVIMVTRKIFSVVLALLLSISFFSNSMATQDGCIGDCCKDSYMLGLQENAQAKLRSPIHWSCSGTHGNPCDLENCRTLDISDSSTLLVRMEPRNPNSIIIIVNDTISNTHLLKGSEGYLHIRVKNRSRPIYLQNLSLLC